jgi:plastocyanin
MRDDAVMTYQADRIGKPCAASSVELMKGVAMELAVLIFAAAAATSLAPAAHATQSGEAEYLPTGAAAKVVSVSPGEASAAAGVTVLTQAVAVKENGPKETVARFGEVYAFAPSFVAVHRDEPTAISFWNLQPDDEHDFMLVDPDLNVLMKVNLPALEKRSYVFTFHRQGLFRFYCTMHQPEMSGQIMVLPPATHSPGS